MITARPLMIDDCQLLIDLEQMFCYIEFSAPARPRRAEIRGADRRLPEGKWTGSCWLAAPSVKATWCWTRATGAVCNAAPTTTPRAAPTAAGWGGRHRPITARPCHPPHPQTARPCRPPHPQTARPCRPPHSQIARPCRHPHPQIARPCRHPHPQTARLCRPTLSSFPRKRESTPRPTATPKRLRDSDSGRCGNDGVEGQSHRVG